jgi:hypothetical protein
MTVDALVGDLRKAWPALREPWLPGTDVPAPGREVQRPKPGGGTRRLGMPPGRDRFITQAMLPVRSPRFAPGFSAHRDGFRLGHRAHQAVEQTCHDMLEGKRRLQVNRGTSAVDRPWKRKFLGCPVTNQRAPRIPAGAPGRSSARMDGGS